MPQIKGIIKIVVIVALLGVFMSAAIGCQGNQNQAQTGDTPKNGATDSQAAGDFGQQTGLTGPRVLFFTADW